MTEAKSLFTDGAAYDKLARRFTRPAGEAFLDWLALPANLEWIDAGCGTGAFTQLVLDRCAPKRVSAFDPSPEQIAYARTTPAAKRIDFQVGDAQAIPFGDAAFDAGTMALVISFVPDPDKSVAELRRVTRPGGMIGAYMWDFLNKGSPRHRLGEAVKRMGVAVRQLPGYAHSRMEAMEGFFKSAGLADVATRVIEFEVTYDNFDEYWSQQTGLASAAAENISSMSAADIERLKADLRANLPKDKAGRIAFRVKANAVKGRVPA
ncbi:MAG: methyltransferase domain-containing protein [Hyphomicrobiales bacterium]|nr:methyltransferase domain-containing protein [Hyphomicrobiales bacterium]MDE1972878.1 methyltransferase domain-containing protein [Hyphomicrobiales bacterium]